MKGARVAGRSLGRTARILGWGAALALAAGCSSADPEPSAPVLTDPAPAGAALFLRPTGDTGGGSLAVQVVLRGAGRVHGVALKLRHAPDALALEQWEPAADVAATGLRLGKASAPGEVSIVVSEVGDPASFDAAAERVLGTARFRVKTRTGALEPVPARSRVVLESGTPAVVAYAGVRFGG